MASDSCTRVLISAGVRAMRLDSEVVSQLAEGAKLRSQNETDNNRVFRRYSIGEFYVALWFRTFRLRNTVVNPGDITISHVGEGAWNDE